MRSLNWFTPRSRGPSILRHAVFLLLVVSLAFSCKDSQVPVVESPLGNTWTPTQTTLTFKTETPDGSESPLVLLATDITWAPGSGILRAQVALHNGGPETLRGPRAVQVFDFSPRDVAPLNAVCGIVPGPCWFEYEGTYGGDGMLAPGETSQAREWQILNIRGEGFRFRSQLLPGSSPGGRIAGVVFADQDKNGQRSSNESGIAGVTVSLRKENVALIATTNARGAYEFTVNEPGVYTVVKQDRPDCESTTPIDMRVVVFVDVNGMLTNFLDADFGCFQFIRPESGIFGRVFLDSNRDGRYDPNESGIPTTITVMPFPPDTRNSEPCAPKSLLIDTNNDGSFFIPQSDLPCEPPWLVQRGPSYFEQSPNNAANLFGTTPREQVVYVLPVFRSDVPVHFGLAPYDSSQQAVLVVEGTVFVDYDENGVPDLNEVPAIGVRLDLLSPCDRLESTWTNGNGYYRFEPPTTDWCPIGGVGVPGSPDATTTENPVLFTPPTEPGIHVIRADFGIRPR